MSMNNRKSPSPFIVAIVACLWLTASLPALAVLTSVPLTDQGVPLSSTTVTIVFPNGDKQEEDTDDNGILLFDFPGDGKYQIIHNGQVIETVTIGGGSGWTSTGKVITGLVVIAGGILIATDDGDNDDPATEPPPPEPEPEPEPGPAELTVTTTEFSLTHTVGDSSCPDPVSPPLVIRNTGGSEMSYQVSVPGQLVSVDGPLSGTLAPGDSVNLTIRFTCSGFVEGPNSTTLTVEARDVPSNTVIGTTQVNINIEVMTPAPSPGMLEFSGAVPPMSKTHTIGNSPCPDPYSPFSITNSGGQPLDFMITDPSWIGGLPSSGSLDPGEVMQLSPVFPCSGFALGPQSGEVNIEATDPVSNQMLPGLMLDFSLTVQQ